MDNVGYIPPAAIELEEVIIGALIMTSESYQEIRDFLLPEHFYKDSNRIIYETISRMHHENRAVDLLTVCQFMNDAGILDSVGGSFALAETMKRIGTAAHIRYHAMIVKQKFISREIIRITAEIQRESYDQSNDVADILDGLSAELLKIESEMTQGRVTDAKKLVDDTIKLVYDRKERAVNNTVLGISTGFYDLNKKTGGWQPADLIILAGRPSMGKTSIAVHFLKKASVYDHVTFVTIEMNREKICDKLIISFCETIPADKYRSGYLSVPELTEVEQAGDQVAKLTFDVIDDCTSLSKIYNVCKKQIKEKNSKLIIIDYLGLIQHKTANRNDNQNIKIGEITKNLKSLAKEMKVPVILLCQLNRELEKRSDHKPILSDLRDSGEIEQDADVVIFVHRDSYYRKDKTEPDTLIGEMIIAKHRNGSIGTIVFRYQDDSMMKLFDYDSSNLFDNTRKDVF